MSEPMDLTTALTGMLPFIVLISALLTASCSALLLWLYRRAVVRSMSKSAGLAAPTPQVEGRQAPSTSPQVALRTETGACLVSGGALAAYRATSASLRRLGSVYAVAGLAYAAVMSVPWMVTAGGGFLPTRLLWLLACYAWPGVLTLLLVATTAWRGKAAIAGIYFAMMALIGAIALVCTPTLKPGELIFFWFFANGVNTALLGTFMIRRIRAVGPLVLAFMVAGVTGAFLTVAVAGSDEGLLRTIAETGAGLGLGASGLFVLLHVIGFTLFAMLGWWLLGRLGNAYRNKRMSDESLTVYALCFLFGVWQSITLAFEGWAWIFTGLIAFAAYKLVTALGFARVAGRGHYDEKKHPSLLVLRVFALGQRSEQLFDVLSKRWLRAGSIDLIAGPDLLTSTVEPHEFLEFVGGRLSRRFIESETDLEQRLAERDMCPDPDGRHRVNEFFCRQDTWQMTMRRLAAGSDAVLMDLRSFSPANKGCLWELEQLLVGVPLDRVVLVIDETTDRPFLEDKLQALWRQVPIDSPNRALRTPSLRLFAASGLMSQAAENLVKCLFQACSPSSS
jgi:hypothetical protein